MREIYLFEAGGDAARSAIAFMKDTEYRLGNPVLVDRDPKALRPWKEVHGYDTRWQEDPSLTEFPKGIDIFPCDEFTRQQLAFPKRHSSRLSSTGIDADLNDKIVSYELVSGINPWFVANRIVSKVVIRESRSAGSKGLRFFEPSPTELATEFIDFGMEVVADFVNYNGTLTICPRITHNLKNGRDTYVTILPHTTALWYNIKAITQLIVNAAKYTGIGNIQYGVTRSGDLKFIEFATRISGSSRVNLLVGYNPIRLMYEEKWEPPTEPLNVDLGHTEFIR